MSAFSRIDAAVLGWHQDLVDALQRRPLWFARWCFAGIVVCLLGMLSLGGLNWFGKAVSAALLLLMLRDVRSEAALARIPNGAGQRLTAAAFVLVFMLLAALSPAPIRAFNLGMTALMAAFMNFAACRPPRPRPPRMATAGGAA